VLHRIGVAGPLGANKRLPLENYASLGMKTHTEYIGCNNLSTPQGEEWKTPVKSSRPFSLIHFQSAALRMTCFQRAYVELE